jgi:hypothetical protein
MKKNFLFRSAFIFLELKRTLPLKGGREQGKKGLSKLSFYINQLVDARRGEG